MSRPGGDSGGGRSSSECAAQTERRPARAREGARSRLKGGPRTLTGAGLAVDALTCLHAGPAPFLPRAGPAPCLTRARTEDRVSVDAPACLHTGLAPFLRRADPAPCLPLARARTRMRSAPRQWRARALARGRDASFATLALWRAPAIHLRAHRPYPGPLLRARAPHCLPTHPDPAWRAHAPSALRGVAARALSNAGREGRWSAREARAVASAAPRVALARRWRAARLFSHARQSQDCHPGLQRGERAGCLFDHTLGN